MKRTAKTRIGLVAPALVLLGSPAFARGALPTNNLVPPPCASSSIGCQFGPNLLPSAQTAFVVNGPGDVTGGGVNGYALETVIPLQGSGVVPNGYAPSTAILYTDGEGSQHLQLNGSVLTGTFNLPQVDIGLTAPYRPAGGFAFPEQSVNWGNGKIPLTDGTNGNFSFTTNAYSNGSPGTITVAGTVQGNSVNVTITLQSPVQTSTWTMASPTVPAGFGPVGSWQATSNGWVPVASNTNIQLFSSDTGWVNVPGYNPNPAPSALVVGGNVARNANTAMGGASSVSSQPVGVGMKRN